METIRAEAARCFPLAEPSAWGELALPIEREREREKCACALLLFFSFLFLPEPQIRRDHPLNLSISISGGRETNQDSPSNGERSGKSSSLKSPAQSVGELWPGEAAFARTGAVEVDLERRVGEGESPVRDAARPGCRCLRRVGLFGNAAQSGW